MKKFKKILIANRGEIAVRVIRACHEMGIRACAVYSDVDVHSLHVRLADESHPLEGVALADTYLNKDKILHAAKKMSVDAVHPGYGFLAENSEFIKACEENNLTFIGPSADSVRAMGSKTQARELVQKAGVPVVPGTTTPLQSVKEAEQTAEEIGFPVLIKASMGGGGRGMRKVSSPKEMKTAFESAQRESLTAFGYDEVYIEKCFESVRHIEVQIASDNSGHTIYLGERECSIQRKNQKLVEESPSPVVDEKSRRTIGEMAVAIARDSNYHNAGTIEFLRDEDGNFYFLEMNTRIQVEHPVTEMVTGFDLVRMQIEIAADMKLTVKQEDVKLKGHAMECRINAEDPYAGFIPSPGKVRFLSFPSGPGVRVDTLLYPNYKVPSAYDSLIAKLIVWGENREHAVVRMRQALREFSIQGIKTTLPFHRNLMEHRLFKAGRISTRFLEQTEPELLPQKTLSDRALVALAAAITEYNKNKKTIMLAPKSQKSSWKWAGRKYGETATSRTWKRA